MGGTDPSTANPAYRGRQNLSAQAITLAATATATYGQAYNLNASTDDTDPGAGLVYSVEADGGSAGCSVDASGNVSFTSTGTCTIDVNSGATETFSAAPQVDQVLTVVPALLP